MKKNLTSAKQLKSFEIGKTQLSSVMGGTDVNSRFPTSYYEHGNAACSIDCPDSKVDYADGTPVK